MPNTKKMNAFAVIGKEGACRGTPGTIQELWRDANGHFDEVSALAKRRSDGTLLGVWGLMSDFSRAFRPWENGFSQGLYLAGVECNTDAVPPEGWTKWVAPAAEYLCVPADIEGGFMKGLELLEQNGFTLAGAAYDFTDPSDGKNYIYYPVKR